MSIARSFLSLISVRNTPTSDSNLSQTNNQAIINKVNWKNNYLTLNTDIPIDTYINFSIPIIQVEDLNLLKAIPSSILQIENSITLPPIATSNGNEPSIIISTNTFNYSWRLSEFILRSSNKGIIDIISNKSLLYEYTIDLWTRLVNDFFLEKLYKIEMHPIGLLFTQLLVVPYIFKQSEETVEAKIVNLIHGNSVDEFEQWNNVSNRFQDFLKNSIFPLMNDKSFEIESSELINGGMVINFYNTFNTLPPLKPKRILKTKEELALILEDINIVNEFEREQIALNVRSKWEEFRNEDDQWFEQEKIPDKKILPNTPVISILKLFNLNNMNTTKI